MPASRTGQIVAALRSRLDRPRTPTGVENSQSLLYNENFPSDRVPGLPEHLAERTAFLDEEVLAALRRGVTQIVILGAGYDDRALRFRAPGVRFFEVDHPGTQQDKRDRLAAAGHLADVTLVGADFTGENPAPALAAAGHDAAAPTVFLCEGLLVYLDRADITALLRAARSRAAPGSVLAATLSVHAEDHVSERGREPSNTAAIAHGEAVSERASEPSNTAAVAHGEAVSAEVVARANAARANGGAEPWRTVLPRSGYLALLADAGWHPDTVVPAPSVGGRPGGTLLVAARPATA